MVLAATGRAVTGVVEVHGSVANRDFVVTVDTGVRVVVKTGPAGEIAAEAWVCRRLSADGMPVPGIVAEDSTGATGHPYLIASFVEGSGTDRPEVLAAAGATLRRVHATQLPGWGPLVPDPRTGSARGRHASWPEAVRAELAGLPGLVRGGLLDSPTAAAVEGLVLVDAVLGYPGPGVLLHHDLKPAHIFATADGTSATLTAVIDWGDARVGDPAADLARLSMTGPATLSAFAAGYRDLDVEELSDRLARYRISWNVAALSYEYRAGGDWFDAYRSGILADIELLSG